VDRVSGVFQDKGISAKRTDAHAALCNCCAGCSGAAMHAFELRKDSVDAILRGEGYVCEV
jgi:hypothetical protein